MPGIRTLHSPPTCDRLVHQSRGMHSDGGGPSIDFATTNSITQGEHVVQLWPLLLERANLEIAFAHRTLAAFLIRLRPQPLGGP